MFCENPDFIGVFCCPNAGFSRCIFEDVKPLFSLWVQYRTPVQLNMRMSGKLADNREELLGDLIRQLEKLQSRTSSNGERIYQLNRQIADVNAQNLVVAQLHSSGILNNAEYAAQSGELNRKVSELRSERRRILMEDEDNEVIESLRALDEIMADYAPTGDFDEDLFGQIVESITVVSKNALRFCLAGGLALTERI